MIIIGTSTPRQAQAGLGRGFILLLLQTAVLPPLHAGSNGVEPASIFFIQNRSQSDARCTGHAVRTRSVVCSVAQHLPFGEGARSDLCMDEWNRATPTRSQSGATQAVLD